MSFLNKLQQWKGTNNRMIQEKVDTLRMFHYTSAFKNYHLKRKTNPNFGDKRLTMEEIMDITDQPLGKVMGFYEHRDSVYKVLHKQIFNLYKQAADTGGKNPYPNPIWRSSDSPEIDPTRIYLDKKMNIVDVEIFQPGSEVEHPEGFKLQVRKSEIDHPESGYGVFIQGAAIPGTVIAIYPGVIYNPTDLTDAIVLDNEYMITRYDYSVIDGKHWEHKHEEILRKQHYFPLATGSEIHDKDLLKFKNPFAIGTYINHPPPGKLPNLQQYSYNYPLDIPKGYHPYIPNIEHKSSIFYGKLDYLSRGMIFVTSRFVCDEELFFNYRYNPTHPYPAWYNQPDLEEAKRRWSPSTIF